MVKLPVIDVEFKDIEKWACKQPRMGDHIRVMRMGGIYSHHGIYVSDDEVIHFTGQDGDSIFDWSKPEVISSDLAHFVKDGVLEVRSTLTRNSRIYIPRSRLSHMQGLV